MLRHHTSWKINKKLRGNVVRQAKLRESNVRHRWVGESSCVGQLKRAQHQVQYPPSPKFTTRILVHENDQLVDPVRRTSLPSASTSSFSSRASLASRATHRWFDVSSSLSRSATYGSAGSTSARHTRYALFPHGHTNLPQRNSPDNKKMVPVVSISKTGGQHTMR